MRNSRHQSGSPQKPTISIITVCYNSSSTIRDTIESVTSQDYANIEYIIIDGNSSDDTLPIVREYDSHISHVISEPDRGLWDAMNKGIRIATGDYIGFLHSDDFFSESDVVSRIAAVLSNPAVDAAYGYVDLVESLNTERVVRRYRVSRLDRFGLRIGLMPAHPAFYCSRDLFSRLGGFVCDASIAPDFELIARFYLKGSMRATLLPSVLVKMRANGLSNSGFWYRLLRFRRQVRSCRRNGLWTNSLLVLAKYPYKLLEYLRVN